MQTKDQWAVVTGEPSGGFKLNGPFDDHDAALRYADTINDSWWVMPILPPVEGDAIGMQELDASVMTEGRAS